MNWLQARDFDFQIRFSTDSHGKVYRAIIHAKPTNDEEQDCYFQLDCDNDLSFEFNDDSEHGLENVVDMYIRPSKLLDKFLEHAVSKKNSK